MSRIANFPVALLPLFVCVQSVFADAEWDALASDYEKAQTAFMKKMDQGGGAVHFDPTTRMPEDSFRPKFRAYAEKHAETPAAVPALGWLLAHEMGFPGMGKTDGAAAWALERLTRSHAADPAIKDHLDGLQFAVMSVGEDALVGYLETVAAKNPDREAKGRARLAMAEILFEGSPFMKVMGGGADRTPQRKRATDIFRSMVKEFAKDGIGKRAAGFLFTVENLQVGMKAPDVVGKSVKGEEIKLSQFNGKVVLIAFWGTWCAPCMQMLPHERRTSPERCASMPPRLSSRPTSWNCASGRR